MPDGGVGLYLEGEQGEDALVVVAELTDQLGLLQGLPPGAAGQDLDHAHVRARGQAEERVAADQLDRLPTAPALDGGGQLPVTQSPHQCGTIVDAVDDRLNIYLTTKKAFGKKRSCSIMYFFCAFESFLIFFLYFLINKVFPLD